MQPWECGFPFSTSESPPPTVYLFGRLFSLAVMSHFPLEKAYFLAALLQTAHKRDKGEDCMIFSTADPSLLKVFVFATPG